MNQGTGGNEAFNLYSFQPEMIEKLKDVTNHMDTGEQLKYKETFYGTKDGRRALTWKLGPDLDRSNAVSDCARLAVGHDRRVFSMINGNECWVHRDNNDVETAMTAVQELGRHKWGSEQFDSKHLPSGGKDNQAAVYEIPESTMQSVVNRLPPYRYPDCTRETTSCLSPHSNMFPGMRYIYNSGFGEQCFKAKTGCVGCIEGITQDGSNPVWAEGSTLRNQHFESCLPGLDTRKDPGPQPRHFADGKYVSYHGCFGDDGSRRTPFSGRQAISSSNVSTASHCARLAARSGKRVFGLEANGECYTAESVQQAKILGGKPLGECSNSSDREGLPMGGANAAAIYEMDDGTFNAYKIGFRFDQNKNHKGKPDARSRGDRLWPDKLPGMLERLW